MAYEINDMMTNLKATELRLGLPGTHEADDHHDHHDQSSSTVTTTTNSKKRQSDHQQEMKKLLSDHPQQEDETTPPAKAQIVGWPPVRSYRKNSMMTSQQKKSGNNNNNNNSEAEICGMFVKVSMDGAPYLRKIDLRVYKNYPELLKALEAMFKFTLGEYSEREGYKGSDYVPTYEDKDGDWMLVGDVPWDMFMSSCKRMRIMRESEARGLGCGV